MRTTTVRKEITMKQLLAYIKGRRTFKTGYIRNVGLSLTCF